MSRKLTPYEQNQLFKYHLSPDDFAQQKDMPIEYFTGKTEFYNIEFSVSPDTLIPRIESEKIIDLALSHIEKNNLTHPTVADIGTGSGCLGISLASTLSQSNIPYTIYLSDISPKSLKVAIQNATQILPSLANLFFEESDLMSSYPKIKFDLILANLPYIPSANIETLNPSVKDFEPHLALDGGPKGTDIIDKLIAALPDFLDANGLAILEIDDTHTLDSFSIPQELIAKIENDCFDKPRFLLLSFKKN